jgi:hypothetical protein
MAKVDLAMSIVRGILNGHTYQQIKDSLRDVPFLEK